MRNPVNKETFSNRFGKHLFEKGEENEEVFKVLNHCIDYLNLSTVKQVADRDGKSVQSVYKKYRSSIKDLLGVKVIIDNE